MANVRNYEEYRAEVLETLGATVEDLRNEPSFRAKVLETLGVDFTDEDTRNFERYRLKALEGLKNGGGGGGSSDFSTADVTFSGISGTAFATMPKIVNTPFDAILPLQNEVTDGTYTMALYKGKAIISLDLTGVEGNVTTSGNIESLQDEVYLVTGDCTITIS